jgi:hypothetical protein
VSLDPNQISEGQEVINLLRNKYGDIYWIDSSFSNAELIRKTNCGISVFGSILVELAYAKKPSIAAGEHPGSAFGISYMPKTIVEYEQLLLNIDKLSALPSARQASVDFYVAHNFLFNKDCVDLSVKQESDMFNRQHELIGNLITGGSK